MKILAIGSPARSGEATARGGADVTVLHRGTSANLVPPGGTHITVSLAEYTIAAFPRSTRRDWGIVVVMLATGGADAQSAVEAFAGRSKRLVLISSCDVYRAYGRLTKAEPGPLEPVPLTESAPFGTVFYPYRGMEEQLGAYARDYEKILAEKAVKAAVGLERTILRSPKFMARKQRQSGQGLWLCCRSTLEVDAWPRPERGRRKRNGCHESAGTQLALQRPARR